MSADLPYRVYRRILWRDSGSKDAFVRILWPSVSADFSVGGCHGYG